MNNIGLNFQGAEQIQNINTAPKQEEKPTPAPTDTTENKPQEFTKEAADAMRANVLYKPSKPETPKTEAKEPDTKEPEDTAEATDTTPVAEKEVEKEEPAEMKEYIPQDATPQDLRDILADKSKVDGRSFFGYKKFFRKQLENSKDPKTTIDNLNILLNANDGKLSAKEISNLFIVTEAVNNNVNEKITKTYKDHYGFKGGKLDKDTLAKMQETMDKDSALGAMMGLQIAMENNQRQMQQQMQIDQMNQQLFDQQNMINLNQQMMINQQMTQPPMGF